MAVLRHCFFSGRFGWNGSGGPLEESNLTISSILVYSKRARLKRAGRMVSQIRRYRAAKNGVKTKPRKTSNMAGQGRNGGLALAGQLFLVVAISCVCASPVARETAPAASSRRAGTRVPRACPRIACAACCCSRNVRRDRSPPSDRSGLVRREDGAHREKSSGACKVCAYNTVLHLLSLVDLHTPTYADRV
jgi:hypothetical protein